MIPGGVCLSYKGAQVAYIVTTDLEVNDLERLLSSGCEVLREGGFPLVRDYFSRFDDEETSEVRYFVLQASIGTEHLVNSQLLNRALVYLVRAHRGRVVIPRQEWDRITGSVGINLGRHKVWIFARQT